MIYEFCLDDLKIKDYLVLSNIHYYQTLGLMFPPKILQDLLEMASRFTNVDPLELPMTEMTNFIAQFVEALDQYKADNL